MATKKIQILQRLIMTDTTLTQSDVPADAKIVGDALAEKVDASDTITIDDINKICGTTILLSEEVEL